MRALFIAFDLAFIVIGVGSGGWAGGVLVALGVAGFVRDAR